MRKSSFKAMLATISLLGVVPVSVNILTNHHSIIPFAKISLGNSITVRNIKGAEANDAGSILAYLVSISNDVNLRVSDIQIDYFIKATEIASGSIAISAVKGSNYIGSVAITIESLPKINLESVITAREIKGEDALSSEVLLKELKNVNPRLASEDVEIQNFKAATQISEGSALVVAKEDTKYTGEVIITLRVMPKIDLKDVIKIREVEGTVANEVDNVLVAIAEVNHGLDLNDVDITRFKGASESAPGSATIVAKEDTKYTGEVSIVINSLPKTALRTVIVETTVNGNEANEAADVLATIAELNQDLDVSSVEVRSFIKATDVTDGSMVISAKANSKYVGIVGITIKKLTDFFLNKNDNNEQQVIAAVNSTEFSKSVLLGSKVDEISTTINAKFMKDRLSEELGSLFDDNLFTINEILNSQGKILSDEDLTVSKTFPVVVNYNYGSIDNQNFNLMLSVKQITRSTERNNILKQIKTRGDNNDDGSEWENAWFSYFEELQTDIHSFSFQFPKEDLNQNKILQNIIYDEIKLVMETDFKFWKIGKGYNPDSVVVTYNKFDLNEVNKELSVKGRLNIQVKSFGDYVNYSALLNYKIGFVVV